MVSLEISERGSHERFKSFLIFLASKEWQAVLLKLQDARRFYQRLFFESSSR